MPEAKQPRPLPAAQFIAVGLYLFAAFNAVVLALMTYDSEITPRQFALLAGVAIMAAGWGGVFAELGNKRVLLRPAALAVKFVVGGAILMGFAQAMRL